MSKPSYSSDVCVQGTNDSSVVSKCSMVNHGYFKDPFIHCFVKKLSCRSPLINRGYYVRAKAIETIVEMYLDCCRQQDHFPIQIISLGAGFDTLYFRIAAKCDVNFEKITFIEVDFMDVVCRKRQIIRSENLLSNLIRNETLSSTRESTYESNGGIVLDSAQYKLIGLDLCDLGKVNSLLRECQVDFEAPTMFLSECAITYLSTNSSNDLIRWAAIKFTNSMFAIYEQILPYDGFGQVMCRHFTTMNAALRSIHEHPDIESQKRRFKNLGWPSCDAIDMNTFVEKVLPAEEIARIDDLELFEEFEEFHSKCSHYALIVATKGTVQIDSFPARRRLSQAIRSPLSINDGLGEIEGHGIVKRFGHRSVFVENLIITVGGFGVSTNGGHSRMKDICVTDSRCGKDYSIPITTENFKSERLFHSLSRLSDGRLILIGGRGSPIRPHSYITVFEFTKTLDKSSSTMEEITSADIAVIQVVSTDQQKPQIRWRHSATVVDVGATGREGIFVFGGKNLPTSALGDCHILFPDRWEWKEILVVQEDRESPCSRHSHSACIWNGNRVVVSGGLDINQLPLNDIHIFDCVQLKWSELRASSLLPRYSHTSHVWKNRLILLGGVSAMATDPPGIGIVDLTTGYTREIALPAMSKPFLFNKHSSLLDDEAGEIIILGGGGTCFSFGTHFNQSAYKLKLREVEQVDLLAD